jgi:hypothetical protein
VISKLILKVIDHRPLPTVAGVKGRMEFLNSVLGLEEVVDAARACMMGRVPCPGALPLSLRAASADMFRARPTGKGGP